jgi:hypothetical protein
MGAVSRCGTNTMGEIIQIAAIKYTLKNLISNGRFSFFLMMRLDHTVKILFPTFSTLTRKGLISTAPFRINYSGKNVFL